MQKKRTGVPAGIRVLLKFWKIMRLSVFFLCLFVAQTYATVTYSQQKLFTLNMHGAKVLDVLNKIEDESEFFFLFNQKLLDVERQVNVDVKNENIGKILSGIFEKTNVTYFVKDRQIILTTAAVDAKSDLEQQKPVKGKVTDSGGVPLPGVSVIVKGTTTGVTTNNDGIFTLSLPAVAKTLVFSFVGMKTQEIEIGNKTDFKITLSDETISLDEVVAVGYGTQKKANLTGAVAAISSKVLESRPLTNLGQGLQGLIPNLNITVGNGRPGTGATFNIRGITSINGGSPLVLVDGVQMDPNQINPNDIENVSVLKDASSSAIYGVRGAFGVVLITTKQGKKNTAMNIDYSYAYTLTSPTRLPKSMNSVDYIKTFRYRRLGRPDNYYLLPL